MELRHLRALILLVEEGSVTRAATRLGLVQQAVSRQLLDLEGELGTRLFERHSRGLRPTPAGLALADRARSILRSVEEASAWTRAAARGARRILRLAPPDTAASLRLFNAVTGRLRRRHRDVALTFEAFPWLEHPRAVAEDQLDVAYAFNIGSAIYPRGVAFERLVDDPGEWALVADRSPLLRRRAVEFDDLRRLPVVLYPRDLSPALHAAQLDGLRRAGARDLPVAAGLHSFVETVQHVAASAAWMLVFRSVALEPPPGTRAVRIIGLEMPAGFDVLWRSGDRDPLVAEVVALSRAAAPRFHARPRRRTRSAREGLPSGRRRLRRR